MATENNANIGFEKQIWDAACVLWKNARHEDWQAVEIQNQRSGRLDEIRRCGGKVIGDLCERKETESL